MEREIGGQEEDPSYSSSSGILSFLRFLLLVDVVVVVGGRSVDFKGNLLTCSLSLSGSAFSFLPAGFSAPSSRKD